jgi:hypothetical protein
LSFARLTAVSTLSGVPISLQLLQHGLVGAAMRRTPQRGDASGNRGVRVGAGGTDQAHGRGGGILLVIGMQDEQQIQRLRGHRIHLQRLARHFEHHVQEAVTYSRLLRG